jgi:hypothetical protein
MYEHKKGLGKVFFFFCFSRILKWLQKLGCLRDVIPIRHIKMLLSFLYIGILLEKKGEKASKEMFSIVQ